MCSGEDCEYCDPDEVLHYGVRSDEYCEDCIAHVLHCDECQFRILRRLATPTTGYCDCTPKKLGCVRWRWLPDFVGYTRQEFRDHYGADGDRIWNESDGLRCGCDSPDEKRFALDWIEYTELEFREHYGADGLRFWHEAQDHRINSTWCAETQQWCVPCFADCEETRGCYCSSCWPCA